MCTARMIGEVNVAPMLVSPVTVSAHGSGAVQELTPVQAVRPAVVAVSVTGAPTGIGDMHVLEQFGVPLSHGIEDPNTVPVTVPPSPPMVRVSRGCRYTAVTV